METAIGDAWQTALRLVGGFYALAGFLGVRASLGARMFDAAIAGIEMKPPARTETIRALWLMTASWLILAGGLALVLALQVSAAVFFVGFGAQLIYLFYVAPRYLDPVEAPEASGRRQSTNAFVLYGAATAFVIWGYGTGRLLSWADVRPGALAAAAFALIVYAAYAAVRFADPLGGKIGHLRVGRFGKSGETAFDDVSRHASKRASDGRPQRPLSSSHRIAVMAEYECHPLWAHDPGLDGDIDPNDLGLTDALSRELTAWGAAYSDAFNPDDPLNSQWSEEDFRAHAAKGRLLAVRLKRELPDRSIFVFDSQSGHVEVFADSDSPGG